MLTRLLHTCYTLVTQPVDGISNKAKKHKYSALTGAIINYEPHDRNSMENQLLLGLWNVKSAKKHGGPSRMISGIDPDTGDEYDEWTPACELDGTTVIEGVEIPNDVSGGVMKIDVEIHFLFFRADALGAHALGPWTESFQAHHCCRDCWFHSKCPCAYLPRGSGELANVTHVASCRQQELRTAEESHNSLEALRRRVFRSKKARADAYRAAGVGKLYYPLMGYKSADLLTDLAADAMHIFLCGLTRHEAFLMLDDLIPACTTWDAVNAQRKIINESLPKGHAIPLLERPRTDSKKKASISMNMNAAETMHFALNRCSARWPVRCYTRVTCTAPVLHARVTCEVTSAVLPWLPITVLQ